MEIKGDVGEIKGRQTTVLEKLGEHSRMFWRLGERIAKVEHKQAQPSSTHATSWHQIIALVLALLAGTLMNIAPKELATIVLRAIGK